jgi:outer membrane protein insertion porin family
MASLCLRVPACLFLLGAFVLSPLTAPAQQEAALLEIREILIEGSQMVEESTVRARIQSREGDPFDPEQITLDVRSIYELGFFEDIKVDAQGFEGGLRVTFVLTEKPIIRSIAFEGNRKLKESDLREKLEFAARSIYSPAAVTQAVQQLKAIYLEKGYFKVSVDTQTKPTGDGEVQLVFVIEEGEKHSIASVRFTGNEAFSDRQLRRVMETKAQSLFSILTGSGKLVEDVLQEDRQRIMNYYHNHGYLESRIGNPDVKVPPAGKRIEITIPITEGSQYRMGTIDLVGDEDVSLDEIKHIISTKQGAIFRRADFGQDLYAINQRYTEKGYAYVKVDYSSKIDPDRGVIDVTLLIDKAQEVRIGRIVVTGNVITRDKVIRRNITFEEGDLFNSADLRKSRRKIMNLGFFEAVDFIPRPREDTVIDIDIALKEKLTGAFSLGIGYSSEDQIAGQLRLTESNLFGRGQSLMGMIEYGAVRKNFSIAFNEPAIWDTKYSLGFKVYDTEREWDEYDWKARGGRLTLGRSIGEFFRGFVTAKHETVDVTNVDELASEAIKDQEGRSVTNSIQLTLIRDSRDNFFNPRHGNRTVLSAEYAGGFLGGDNYFTKYTAETSQFIPLFWKLVFMARARVGQVEGFDGRDVPVYERFYVGGIYSVRGFELRDIGPKDENGDPTGGFKELVLNAEIILPISEAQGVNVVFFFDAGNAWDEGVSMDVTDLRTGAGLGIRWLSPMGPFRLEWGWNLNPRPGESGGDWAFAVGTMF